MLYPLRPPILPGATGEDPGYASPADSPIPVCGGGDIAEPEDDTEVVEDGGCIRIGKGQPEPREPTPAEVNRHNLTHLPYRSWCPHCVAARRANSPHAAGSKERQKPLFVSDYCSVSDCHTEGDNLTVLVGKLYPPKSLFAVVCDCKGAHDEYTVGRLCQFLRECGVKDFVYKSDQEASVIALVNEVLRKVHDPRGHVLRFDSHGRPRELCSW